jgi:hypothetical protein
MVQPKTVTLWQTYKKSTTTLVCATASAEGSHAPARSAVAAPGCEAATSS